MVKGTAVIREPGGLHIRPAKELCSAAVSYECQVMLRCRGRDFNAKSVIGLLSACIQEGTEVELLCSGPDEKEALEKMLPILNGTKS